MQTSIATWLKKPTAVTQADVLQVERPPACKPSSTGHTERPRDVDAQPLFESPTKTFTGRVPPRPLPPQASIAPITTEFIPAFRRLNSLLLPIPYQDKFFKETIDDPIIASLTRVALWTSDGAEPRLVGAIRCRLVPDQNPSCGPSLYISTIGTLAPYRGHGLAIALLDEVVGFAVRHYSISCITAHAWAANEEGLEWYAKRDFREVNRVEGYYRKLNPSTAVLIRKDVGVLDALRTNDP